MKPPRFDYLLPRSLDEALGILRDDPHARHGVAVPGDGAELERVRGQVVRLSRHDRRDLVLAVTVVGRPGK